MLTQLHSVQVKHMDKRVEKDVSVQELVRELHSLLGPVSHASQQRASLQRSSLPAAQPEPAAAAEDTRRGRR